MISYRQAEDFLLSHMRSTRHPLHTEGRAAICMMKSFALP